VVLVFAFLDTPGTCSPPMASSDSTALTPLKQYHCGTRLLCGLTLTTEKGPAGVDACIIHDGDEKPEFLRRVRLGELAHSLYETSEAHAQCIRALRFLSDGTKRDFLLRPTRQAVLIRSDFVRALIEPSRVVFVKSFTETPTFDKFLAEFQENVQGVDRDDCTFGIFAVEAIICAVVNIHTVRLQAIQTVAAKLLDRIRCDHSEESVLQLYPLKKAVTSFIESMRPLVHCLHGILHSDFDREAPLPNRHVQGHAHGASACLGLPAGSPDGAQHERHQHRMHTQHSQDSGQHERHRQHLHTQHSLHSQAISASMLEWDNLEQVLEHWHINAEEVLADAMEINCNIEDTMHFLEASMSCTRNKLLMFELITAGGTLALTIGALISGIFGMNLKTNLEEAQGAFVIAVAVIAALALLVIFMSAYFISRSKRHYKENSAVFGNNQFFRSICKDDYVLNLCGGLEEGRLPTADEHAVLRDLSKTALPENQISQSNIRRYSRRLRGSLCSFDSSARASTAKPSDELLVPFPAIHAVDVPES